MVYRYSYLSHTKNILKRINENVSGKYNSQKLHDHDKQSTTDAIRTSSKRPIQKIAKGIGDLIGNKIADRIIETTPSKSITSM